MAPLVWPLTWQEKQATPCEGSRRDAVVGDVEPRGLKRRDQQAQAVELLGGDEAVEHVEVVGVGDLDPARDVAHLRMRGQVQRRRKLGQVAVRECRSRRRSARARDGPRVHCCGEEHVARWSAAGDRAASRGRCRRRGSRPARARRRLPSFRRRRAGARSARPAAACRATWSRRGRSRSRAGSVPRAPRAPPGRPPDAGASSSPSTPRTACRDPGCRTEVRPPPPNWNSPPGGFGAPGGAGGYGFRPSRCSCLAPGVDVGRVAVAGALEQRSRSPRCRRRHRDERRARRRARRRRRCPRATCHRALSRARSLPSVPWVGKKLPQLAPS